MAKVPSYKITFALVSGYSGVGKTYTPKFATNVASKWMDLRLEQDLPVVNGMLHFGTLLFAARGRRKDGNNVSVGPAGVYAGELLSKQLTDREVKETLNSLASELKEKLKQDKVFIIYKDNNWFV